MFLSFVVPVYNAAQYLPECLDSLLAQDISDYEIICVNDGSRDASPEILGQYAAKHGNIRVIDKENGGVVSARNAGLSAAQGDFIWFVDADDFLLPNILGFLRNKAAETACDRLIVGGYQFTDRLTDEEIQDRFRLGANCILPDYKAEKVIAETAQLENAANLTALFENLCL